jgi:signal transduction histidine kinase
MINYVIHPENRDPSSKQYRKAYWASWLMSIITLSIFFYSIFFIFYHPDDTVKQITNSAGVFFLGGILVQMRFSKNLNLVMTQVALCGIVPIMISIYHTGGIFSVDIIWLFLSIICAYLVAGIGTGIAISTASVLYISALYYLDIIKLDATFKAFVLSHDSTHNLITILFVMILISAILIVFVQSFNKANKTIEQIKEAQIQKLQESLKKKTDELTLLRSDLAKDFHDEMGNKLASISILSQSVSMKLKEKESDEITNMLQTIEKRSNELFYGTKDFIWSIGLKSDYVEELFVYLREFGEVFLHEVEIDLVANIQIEKSVKITPTASRNLVYIAKEIFTNAVKHAHCSTVSFSIVQAGEHIVFEISDDGKGFNTTQDFSRGINNILNRVKKVGGQITINSTPPEGTKFIITLPILSVPTYLG